MIEFKNKIEVRGIKYKPTKLYAKNFKLGDAEYDMYGKYWEIGEDINFDKFWFREVKK